MAELSYQFDYAKTSRGSCKGCLGGIEEGELRIGVEGKSGFHDGIDVKWNHVNCVTGKTKFQNTKLSTTKGWDMLRWEDLMLIKENLVDDVPIDEKREKEFKKRNDEYWKARDKLAIVQPKFLKELMAENGRFLDGKNANDYATLLAGDLMAFGRLQPCPKCKKQTLQNHIFKIKCHGSISEYEKCGFETDDFSTIKRYKPTISDKMKNLDKKGVLKNWKFRKDFPTEEFKLIGEEGEEGEEKKEVEMEIDNEPEDTIEDEKVLRGMVITVCGTKKNLDGTVAEYNEMIKEFGGEVSKDALNATVCVSSDEDMKAASTVKIKDAKENLTCLKIEWLVNLIEKGEDFMKLRTKEGASEYLCEGCEWKTEILRKKYHKPKDIVKETFRPLDDCDLMKVHDKNSLGSGTKVVLENDPVYGWTAYNVILSKVEIKTGRNSFYHMQIVQKGEKYQMMFQWGRVGEKENEVYRNGELFDLKSEWASKFKECTGNDWENRTNFKKIPGRYFMQKLDDGKDEKEGMKEMSEEVKKKMEEKKALLKEKAKESYLDERVSNLIEMIFDTNMMKQTLVKQGLNVDNMPLGKIKISQMKEAMRVLSQLSNVISPESELSEDEKKRKIEAYTTQYYELVPHVMKSIILIDNDEKIKQELKLVETMCDVGEAMSLIEEDEELDLDAVTKIYANYKKLNTKITALDKETERFKLLEEFFVNNQEKGHYRGKVNVVDIFEIERDGERERFKPNAEDPNRQLLYHGSRLTNFVGILSTGLRIAPPEAPCNGYRYGKGLYFANCASKSVSYCTYNSQNRGCMLLCEVALGRQWETQRDKYMEKPQPGSDSTYALGRVEPDPKDTVELDDGVKVNKGQIIKTEYVSSWNTHSELIVYDVARVTIRYLVIFELP